jgi:hypothetical protein
MDNSGTVGLWLVVLSFGRVSDVISVIVSNHLPFALTCVANHFPVAVDALARADANVIATVQDEAGATAVRTGHAMPPVVTGSIAARYRRTYSSSGPPRKLGLTSNFTIQVLGMEPR